MKFCCGMIWMVGGLLWAVIGSVLAQQDAEPVTNTETTPTMTLETKSIRTATERIGGNWSLPQAVPDMRLTLRRPDLQAVRDMNPDLSLEGIEVQLPMKGLWVGVANDEEDGPRRATVSLQRKF